ncbi:MAG TPA: malto-oligosyltrehalose trehalohydrolase [Jatrophihabitans sp.]|jgi:maltooligosyltrehalose trehalohydrolase
MQQIRVWAPRASTVALRSNGEDVVLTSDPQGWWIGPELPHGADYAFVLDGTDALPDPASRWQPAGVHGTSRAYDQSLYDWSDTEWRGRPWEGAVVYELHIGTFTPGATLDSAIGHLGDLVDLGITHVELLPLNAFNGIWNWGYDGVDWYAVHAAYGGPDALKRFVDAAHALGLAVILDVVYNHLGPSGNYLPRFGPYLKDGTNTWGDLVNVEQPEVRRFVVDNALMWIRDFHVDGLRLDAVHAIGDSSPRHVLAVLADEVHAFAEERGRTVTLIAESDLNDVQRVVDEWGLDAQWDDDVHHALHVALTGETRGYYKDFADTEALPKVLTRAFLHDGSYSSFRGENWGRPVDPTTPGSRFVVCLQNHDQVGNRAVGDRLPELTSPGLVKVGAVLLLTSPFTPMLWMGEEWAASTRWPFFTSHPEPELAAAVGAGRLREFAEHGWDVAAMIDPQDPRAYEEAILRWNEREEPAHAEMLALYRELIALRAAEPDLRDPDLRRIRVAFDVADRVLHVHRGAFAVIANLSGGEVEFAQDGTVVLATGGGRVRDGALPGESAVIVRRPN